jgi:hypothetical protein
MKGYCPLIVALVTRDEPQFVEAQRGDLPVSRLARRRETCLQQRHGRLVVALFLSQRPRRVEDFGTLGRGAAPLGHCGVGEGAALAQVAAQPPEPPEGPGQAYGHAGVVVRERRIHRGADVVVLGFESVEPFGLS